MEKSPPDISHFRARERSNIDPRMPRPSPAYSSDDPTGSPTWVMKKNGETLSGLSVIYSGLMVVNSG